MKRRVSAAIISVFFLIVSASFSAFADINLNSLAGCRRVYAYSGESCAYFYGYDNHLLCSARVTPDETERTVSTDGVIRAVCHDEANAYALLTTSNRSYSLLILDMNSGNYRIYPIAERNDVVHSSFAVSDGEVFLITCGAAFDRVESYDLSGRKLFTYDFDRGVNYLFVNGKSAYAVTNPGKIFRIAGGNSVFCADIGEGEDCRNAGHGYIRVGNRLISLTGGAARNCSEKHAVISSGELYSSSEGILFAAANGKTACMDGGHQVSVRSRESVTDIKENDQISAKDIIAVEAGTTVGALKKSDGSISAVYDGDGDAISSGRLRTGYSVRRSGVEIPVAVMGDLNASGTVNSADTSILMRVFVNDASLLGAFLRAADMNVDGNVDNLDLVLIAKASE